jgi:hypothetical protein
MFEQLKDELSPEAIAVIIAQLQIEPCDDRWIREEVDWFRFKLIEILGGDEAYDAICEEIGI